MPRPTLYIHGVRADDWHWTDAWNFSLGGTRSSIGIANAATEAHVTPYEVDLGTLSGPPQAWPPLFLSGFLSTLLLGSIVRAGGHVGQGAPPYGAKWATPETEAQILRSADRERPRRPVASAACGGSDPLWEHLIEGMIQAADPVDLQRLRDFIVVNGPPADMKAGGAAT